MRPIVYLASYPRSGNTFTRALLANYFADGDRPLTPREIAFFGTGEKDEKIWRLVTGLDRQERTVQIEWAARQAYLAQVRNVAGSGPVFLKTHTVNGTVLGAPAFFFEPQDRIIYIVRDPLDVLVSAAHFFGLDIEAMAGRLLASGAFNTSDGGYFEVTGSWTENVSGWVTETACPVLIVLYEALRLDTAAQLRRMLEFLGEAPSQDRVDKATKAAGFEGLQAAHAEHGFYQGPGRDPRHSFFRAGQAGQWRSALPESVAARMIAELGPFRQTFGYDVAAHG
jgi:hypothetical protein